MGFFSRAFGQIRSIVKSAAGLAMSPIYGGGSFFSGTKASQEKLMQEAVGWVFSCITRISETLISERLRLYKKSGNGAEDWTEITQHDFLDLIQKPNKWMTGADLMQMTSQHEDLTGNAYWLLDGVTSETDQPTAIYPLNPAYMKVLVGAVVGEPDQITGYEYKVGSQKRTFQPYEILHFRRINPNDPFRGLGPTEGSMDSIDTDNWMREWNRRFFQNSAIPGVILETNQTSETMIRLLRESFEDRHAGVSRAHKTVALPNGVKLAQMGYGQKDMDFIESRSKNRDEILSAFGVPPIVLGLGLGESINRATAEVQEYVYAKYTIKPRLMRYENVINEFFLSRFGDNLAVQYDNPVPKNVEQEITQNTAALGGAPYKTINEVRTSQGLEPIEGGDVIPERGPSVPTQQVNRFKKIITLNATAKKSVKAKEVKTEIVGKIVAGLEKSLFDVKKKAMDTLTQIDWEENWKAFADRTVEGEKKMRDTISAYGLDVADRAEIALRKTLKGKKKAFSASKLLDRDEEVATIIELMNPLYVEILKNEGASAAALIEAAFDENEEAMRKALDKSIKLMAESYTDTTLEKLSVAITDGLETGEGLDALSQRIQDIGAWNEKSRADAVARTEAFRTANLATKEAWKQSGVVQTIKWYTAEDERVCPDCDSMNGKVVGVDQNFFEKGDVTETGLEITYAPVEGGSLHVNCRCSIAPEKIEI